MGRADDLRALLAAVEPPEPQRRTRIEWLAQAETDAANGDWLLAAVSCERAQMPKQAAVAWTRVVQQGPTVLGWPIVAIALARLNLRAESKAAWVREARLRRSRGEWGEAALAHSMAGEHKAEHADWISLAVAATKSGDHPLAYTAWELAGETVLSLEAAERQATHLGDGFHRGPRENDPARALDAGDWWEAAGLLGRAKSSRDSVFMSEAVLAPAEHPALLEISNTQVQRTKLRRLAVAAEKLEAQERRRIAAHQTLEAQNFLRFWPAADPNVRPEKA